MIRRDLFRAIGLLLFPVLLLGQQENRPARQEPCAPVIQREFEADVIGVTDGDTIRVQADPQTTVKVRLEGIDAPEAGQDHGAKAKQALSDLVFGKSVTLKVTGEDRYGRTLAYVFVGDLDVNAKMVEDGWAWHFRKYNCEERLAELEEAARAAKRGLWAHKLPVPPWEFRRQREARKAREEAAQEAEEERKWQRMVKEQLASPESKLKPRPKPQVAPPPIVPRPVPIMRAAPGGAYWLNTSTSVRHNARCQHYRNTARGRPCGPGEGRACRQCGG